MQNNDIYPIKKHDTSVVVCCEICPFSFKKQNILNPIKKSQGFKSCHFYFKFQDFVFQNNLYFNGI